MKYIRKKFILILGIIITVILVLVISLKINLKENSEVIIESDEVELKQEQKKEEEKYVYIDIKGEVNKPGVYKLEENKRLIDVVNEAGGFTEKADETSINLSEKVEDQMLIIIYSKDEVQTAESNNSQKSGNTTKKTNGKISLNNGTKQELMSISGIGETKANAIIKYRETSRFTKIEDLLNVNGIGKATYEKIKEFFTL